MLTYRDSSSVSIFSECMCGWVCVCVCVGGGGFNHEFLKVG